MHVEQTLQLLGVAALKRVEQKTARVAVLAQHLRQCFALKELLQRIAAGLSQRLFLSLKELLPHALGDTGIQRFFERRVPFVAGFLFRLVEFRLQGAEELRAGALRRVRRLHRGEIPHADEVVDARGIGRAKRRGVGFFRRDGAVVVLGERVGSGRCGQHQRGRQHRG